MRRYSIRLPKRINRSRVSEMVHKLEFINKIFGDKVNYTVRSGNNKWEGRVEINDVIEIDGSINEDGVLVFDEISENNIPFPAVVTDVGTCRFKNLPEKVFRFFHDLHGFFNTIFILGIYWVYHNRTGRGR